MMTSYEKYPGVNKQKCEYLRQLSKTNFDRARSTWIECGRWASPHRIKWMLSQMEGERNNAHIVDATHVLALRSYVAGFLEGNTSASRPWYRYGVSNPDLMQLPDVRVWLERFTNRTLQLLGQSNFYNAAGQFYYDFGVFNTGAHYIDEMDDGLFFHTLTPGSYYLINNNYNEPVVMIREFSLTVKAIVDGYAKKNPKTGKSDMSNISPNVRKMYEESNYMTKVSIVHAIYENPDFDPSKPQVLLNRKWLSVTYEWGTPGTAAYQMPQEGIAPDDPGYQTRFLKVAASRRKPFIVGKSDNGGNNYEYGEKGPTLDALGLIKSLNKKAIAKDQALEQMLRPALQGPANLKKSYITSAANSFVPLDANSLKPGGGLRSIFEVNPAISDLLADQSDLRGMVNKLYYADYLLYLSQHPKTRTATETNAVVQEQQLVIGPNLQSLNTTYNVPLVEFIADYCLFDDPVMQQWPMPQALAGASLRPEFISVFAQAQRAADLPSVERYMAMVEQVGQLRPQIWDKVNTDELADIYEDRLFLPAGLNNAQSKVDAQREQAQQQQQRQQALQETIPALAGAAKDMSQAQQPQRGPQ